MGFGEIYKTYLIYDKQENVSRGFGFVEFKSFGSADNVTDQKEHYLQGKLIECKNILHKAEIDELRSKYSTKKKTLCEGSENAGLGSNGSGKGSNKTRDDTPNISPAFEQTSNEADGKDLTKVNLCTQTNSGDLKSLCSDYHPVKFLGSENPDPNFSLYSKNYLGYPDQRGGRNSPAWWDICSDQWLGDSRLKQYCHEDLYYNGFMSTEHSNSSSNYNSNSSSNYNYNSKIPQGPQGTGGLTGGVQYQNPFVNHANNAPPGFQGKPFYKPHFGSENLNVLSMPYFNLNAQDRNPMNAANPQTFSTHIHLVSFIYLKKVPEAIRRHARISGHPRKFSADQQCSEIFQYYTSTRHQYPSEFFRSPSPSHWIFPEKTIISLQRQ